MVLLVGGGLASIVPSGNKVRKEGLQDVEVLKVLELRIVGSSVLEPQSRKVLVLRMGLT